MGKINRTNFDSEIINELDRIKETSDDLVLLSEKTNIHLADTGHVRYIGSVAGADIKTVTTDLIPITAKGDLIVGSAFRFVNTTANTGAVTLAVKNSIKTTAAYPMLSDGSDIKAGKLKAGLIYTVAFDGSNFQLQGEGGDYGNVTPSDVTLGKTFGTDEGLKVGTLAPGAKLYRVSTQIRMTAYSGSEAINSVSKAVIMGFDFLPNSIIVSGSSTSFPTGTGRGSISGTMKHGALGGSIINAMLGSYPIYMSLREVIYSQGQVEFGVNISWGANPVLQSAYDFTSTFDCIVIGQ